MTSIVQFYPNGEFSQGYDTSRRRKPSKAERLCRKLHKPGLAPVEEQKLASAISQATNELIPVGSKLRSPAGTIFVYDAVRPDGGIHLYGENEYGEKIEIEYPYDVNTLVRDEKYVLLVHQTVEFSQNPPVGRKRCLRMSRRLGRQIRNASYILEQDYGKDSLSFLTLTLPSLTPEGLSLCNQNWSTMVDRFLKWLRSRFDRLGYPFSYTYCTEVQPKRLQNRGEYALHLHLLFVGRIRKKSAWVVTPLQCRKAWTRIIVGICGEQFTTTALENLQRIRRSASSYLSKYLSKGKDGYASLGLPEDAEVPIMHWGGMARHLSREITRRSSRFRGDGAQSHIANMFVRFFHSGGQHPAVKFIKTAFIEFSTRTENTREHGIWVATGCLRKGLHTSILADLIADLYSRYEHCIYE